jgi:hypothetical protein
VYQAQSVAELSGLCHWESRIVITSNPDPLVVQRNDVNEAGFQVTKLILESGLQLPFASYSGKHVVWYAGWQPSGFFGFKFNLHKEVGRGRDPDPFIRGQILRAYHSGYPD